jgi:hypothetical protein
VDNGGADNGVGGDQILFLSNGLGYIFNITTNVFSQIIDVNFPVNAEAATFLDGYFIVTNGTMGFYVSALYDGTTWPPFARAAAVSTPDDIRQPFALNQQLYLIKDSTTEIWYNDGTQTSTGCPFARTSGGVLNFGTSSGATVTRCGDTTFMLATTRVQDSAVYFGVVSFSGTAMQKVSTQAVDYRISRLTTLSDAFSYSYVSEGHLFYVLTFPTDDLTLVYDVASQEWHERSSYVANSPGQHRHLSNCYAFFAGKHLVGHYALPRIYEMSSEYYDDATNPIIRIRTAPVLFDPNERNNIKIFKLQIDAEMGVGITGTNHNADPKASLSWSNDGGHTWSSEYAASLGKIGEYKKRLIWRKLGSPKNRIFRLTISDAVKVVLFDAVINDGAIG